MGGLGSGGMYKPNAKKTVENQNRLSIYWLRKQGCLKAGAVGKITWASSKGEDTGSLVYSVEADRMVLVYGYQGNQGWEEVEQQVLLVRIPCFAADKEKVFFECPHCKRRAGILYGLGKYFLCRLCCNLTYSSQQSTKLKRLVKKAQRIREDVGGIRDLLVEFPAKPKRMHWATYNGLLAQSEQARCLAWVYTGQRYGFLDKEALRGF